MTTMNSLNMQLVKGEYYKLVQDDDAGMFPEFVGETLACFGLDCLDPYYCYFESKGGCGIYLKVKGDGAAFIEKAEPWSEYVTDFEVGKYYKCVQGKSINAKESLGIKLKYLGCAVFATHIGQFKLFGKYPNYKRDKILLFTHGKRAAKFVEWKEDAIECESSVQEKRETKSNADMQLRDGDDRNQLYPAHPEKREPISYLNNDYEREEVERIWKAMHRWRV